MLGITVAVFSGFCLAWLAPIVVKYFPAKAGWILALVPASIFIFLLTYLPDVTSGKTVSENYRWVPDLGINLDFQIDGLALIFALIISGIGILIFIYSGGYLEGHLELGRFYLILMVFMAAMLGIVLSDNLIMLFMFWELTTISSFLLIGFDHSRMQARAAAIQALLTTGLGGIALLAGLLLIGQAGDDYRISTLLFNSSQIQDSEWFGAITVLILLGAFTKSAQFPFHFWLPNAMEAPTPVSAYLHSATMVNAGIYLMARFTPVFDDADLWMLALTVAGAITMMLGAWVALTQTDYKRILAYTTLSILGLLTLLIGVGTETAFKAMLIYLIGHACYKGSLFMVAGAVDHETGTRQIPELGGLRKSMPVVAGAAGLAALSMAGVPPMLGFIAKETFYKAVDDAPNVPVTLLALSVFASIGIVAAAIFTGFKPFFGQITSTPKQAHRAPVSLWLGPVILAVTGLLAGVYPASIAPLIGAGVESMTLATQSDIHVELWPGFNFILLLSLATIAAGVGLFFVLARFRQLSYSVEPSVSSRMGPTVIYGITLRLLQSIANRVTGLLQNGYLRYYIISVILAATLFAGYPLFFRSGIEEPLLNFSDVRIYEAGLVLMIAAAAVASIHSRSRLASIASLGVVGYGISIIFVLFGAPDLAMTQFLVETLTVILLVLVFYHLPGYSRLTSTAARGRDIVIAVTFGALTTTLVLVTNRFQYFTNISGYYLRESYDAAYGQNVVNVILVDFRAMDTLGEISVLVIAALGVYALLKLRMEDAQK